MTKWHEQCLERTIAPLDVATFMQSYWGRVPLLVPRQDPEYYSPLLSEETLEHALRAAAMAPGAVEELSDDQRPKRIRNYAAAQESLQQGRSLRIDAIQRFSRELALFCHRLEQELGCPVNVNMYFSPGSSRALKQHYDTHDVFVLQVYGQKKWRLFDSTVPFPLEYLPPLRCERPGRARYRFDQNKNLTSEDKRSVTNEFTLKSGDLLYLPRGFWHVAEAEPAHFSCHLTVGAQTFTYLDLMTIALAQAASRNIRLRNSLPFNFLTDSSCRRVVLEDVRRILETLPEQIDGSTALSEVAEIFVRSRQPITAGFLRPAVSEQSQEVALDSNVSIRDGILCTIAADGDTLSLAFDSKTLSMPVGFEPSLRFIINRWCFAPRELPGDLADEDKLALIQRLIAEGLLCAHDLKAKPQPGSKQPDGWLPVRIDLQSRQPTIQWLYFDHAPLSEPMFAQTIARLRSQIPPAATRITGLEALLNVPGDASPSGFIFHVSRCGSTLVSNSMRSVPGTVVVSEAQPFGPLLMPGVPERDRTNGRGNSIRDDLLRSTISAFSRRRSGKECGLVVKFTSWQILSLPVVRRLWPEVPCLVVIRDPLEVMVSCLQKPPGWMKFKSNYETINRLFGWSEQDLESMSDETFCARMLGEFFNVAGAQVGGNCRVLDYSNLKSSRVAEIIRFCGLDAERIDIEMASRCFDTYSKDARGVRKFGDDKAPKQQAATDAMRREVETWATGGYASLREAEQW